MVFRRHRKIMVSLVAIAALAFLFKRSGPLLQIIYNFSNYAKYPLAIYPSPIRILLVFVLPFGVLVRLLLYSGKVPYVYSAAL